MANRIKHKKLKSLHQRKAEAKLKTEKSNLSSIKRANQKIHQYAGRVPIVVPLAGMYGMSLEREIERARFYGHMHRVFGLDGWNITKPNILRNRSHGRDGKPIRLKGYNRLSKVDLEDVNAAPFEWLWYKGRLKKLPKDLNIEDIQTVRIEAALSFREEWHLSQVSEMQSTDWVSSGGGGFGPKSISATKVEAMTSIGVLRSHMKQIPPIPEIGNLHLMEVLESVVVMDRWIWSGQQGDRLKQSINTVLCAIDCAAIHYGALTLNDFRDIWPLVRFKERKL